MSTLFITGATRGFGRRLLDDAVARGDRVVAGARNPSRLADDYRQTENVLPVSLDVTQPSDALAAVEEATARFGQIDIVINNAGYGIFGSVEETSDRDVRDLFDTNVFGLLNVTRAVLPTLRGQGHGHLINISSSAGFGVGAGRGLYGASKFAVEAISEALHAELAPLGVQVTVIEPGSFRTDFLSQDSRRESPVTLADYQPTVGALLEAITQNDGKQPGDPHKAVEAIRSIAGQPGAPLRLPLGVDAVKIIEGKLEYVKFELDEFRDTSLSTGYPTEN